MGDETSATGSATNDGVDPAAEPTDERHLPTAESTVSSDQAGWRRLLPVALVAGLLGVTIGLVAAPRADGQLTAMGTRAGDAAEAIDGRPEPTVPEPPSTTTTEAPPASLPIPNALPANPYAATDQIVLGTLEIPKLGVVAPLQQGMTLTAINRGPSHWPGTAMPGEPGNVVVAGHRTTYSKPFADLDLLEEGDLVHFNLTTGESFVYEVRGVIIVPAAAIGIASQTWAHSATLFACHPKGSATHRVVAKLKLLDENLQQVDTEAALPPMDVGLRPEDYSLTVRVDDGAPAMPPGGDPFAGTVG